eukprot:gene12017-15117_t
MTMGDYVLNADESAFLASVNMRLDSLFSPAASAAGVDDGPPLPAASAVGVDDGVDNGPPSPVTTAVGVDNGPPSPVTTSPVTNSGRLARRFRMRVTNAPERVTRNRPSENEAGCSGTMCDKKRKTGPDQMKTLNACSLKKIFGSEYDNAEVNRTPAKDCWLKRLYGHIVEKRIAVLRGCCAIQKR